MEEFKREIQTYQNHFWDFYDKQNPIVQKKIDWTIDLIKVLKIVPKTYFKYLTDTDGLWEIRIKAGNGLHWDTGFSQTYSITSGDYQ